MNKKQKAKELLVWYFHLSSQGVFAFDEDNQAEIENIVDLIIQAAIEEIENKIKPSPEV